MIDEPSQSFLAWLGQHFTLVATIGGWVIACSSFVFTSRQTTKDVKRLFWRVERVETSLTNHSADIARHIDPVRDERRWQELYRVLERIEDKVDGNGTHR